jgi:hypothetical protein
MIKILNMIGKLARPLSILVSLYYNLEENKFILVLYPFNAMMLYIYS